MTFPSRRTVSKEFMNGGTVSLALVLLFILVEAGLLSAGSGQEIEHNQVLLAVFALFNSVAALVLLVVAVLGFVGGVVGGIFLLVRRIRRRLRPTPQTK